MGRKILLNLLLTSLKQAMGQVDFNSLLANLFKVVTADGQAGTLAQKDDHFVVLGPDGKEVHQPATLSITLHP